MVENCHSAQIRSEVKSLNSILPEEVVQQLEPLLFTYETDNMVCVLLIADEQLL